MEKREDDAYLVIGNQKHYPIRDFIVTPAEMIEIIKNVFVFLSYDDSNHGKNGTIECTSIFTE